MALQDYTTFTEVDPNSHLLVTSTNIAWTLMSDDESAYVYKDFGVDYFNGNFEHRVEIQVTTAGTFAIVAFCWGLSNNIGDFNTQKTNNQSHLAVGWYNDNNGGGNRIFRLYEQDGTTQYVIEGTTQITQATTYYLKIVRDEAVGTFGTCYCYVYSDSGRTTLIDTLTATLHTSKKDFRYLYGVSSLNSGDARTSTGFAQNLNLIEASGPANLKTYNTNAKANIKTIDTNVIANVKTFDTNV